MGELRSLPVPEGLEGERLDAALGRLFGLSRTKAADLAEAGRVTLDGSPVGKSTRVTTGAWLEVELPDPPTPVTVVAETVEGLRIVHDDDDVVVVDKPVGVAAHPSPGWTGPTVVGGLAGAGYRISTSGAAERQGVVHRLDVGTTGLMVVAKSERAYTLLKRQFKDRTVEKVYHAVVQGQMDPSRGTIDAPIDRHPQHEYRWAVVTGGKPSVTHYETLEAFRHASLLEVHLETGRTHQIRVHTSAMRHPIVGDLTYGADPVLAKRIALYRQWLHAVRLGFEHPGLGPARRVHLAVPRRPAARARRHLRVDRAREVRGSAAMDLDSAVRLVDERLAAFRTDSESPGTAYALLKDGEVVHLAGIGTRTLGSDEAAGRRHRVPHRVDDQERDRVGGAAAARPRRAAPRRPARRAPALGVVACALRPTGTRSSCATCSP